MALENILATIKKETGKEIELIEEQSKKTLVQIRADFEQRLMEKKSKILKTAKNQALKKAEQEKFRAENEKRSRVLEAKRQILDEVYGQAEKELAKESEEQKKALLTRLIKKLPPEKEGYLIPTEKSAGLLKKTAPPHLTVAKKELAGEGGFVFSSPVLEIDNRYAALVEQARGETESEIAKILFT